jgi:hypothetical protein
MVVRVLLVLVLLSGCSMTKMENIYVDNSATNNFVGNPCKFYIRVVGDAQCIIMKHDARNPENPYKNDK